MDIKQFLPSNKKNDLRYHEWYEGSDDKPFYCKVCYQVVSGPAYVYQYSRSRYTFTVHKTCAESLCEIQHHPLHPHHPLQADCTTLKLVVGREIGFICSGCRHYSFGFGYGCRACDFKLDFQCAFPNLEIQPQLPIRREIKADFHEHKLQHFYHNMLLSAYHPQQLEDIVCSYCSKGINGSAFACIECDLFIHEPCIYKVPHGKQIISPFHLDHPLFLQLSDRQRRCGACSLEFRRGEFFLSCGECSSIFETYHISCGSFVGAGLRLKEHHEKHVMLYVYSASGFVSAPRMCCVCNTGCDSCHAYCCLDCNVFVHLECIPLPRAVKHASHSSYHDHPLILSNSTNLLNFSSNEYHCLVCEKQGNINHLFYHCDQCSDMAHIDCILSEEEPPSEVLEYLIPRPIEKFEPKPVKDFCAEFFQQENLNQNLHQEALANDLQHCTIHEIDERIASIKNQMENLASQLEVHQKVRVNKMNQMDCPIT